jgi:hypothetical protein
VTYETWIVIGTVFIRRSYRQDGLQSHGTVYLKAFTNNALAGHLRVPPGPSRPTLLPGPTRTARLAGLAKLLALALRSISSTLTAYSAPSENTARPKSRA